MSGSTPCLPPAATSSTAAPGRSVDSVAASTPNVPTTGGGAAQLLAARRLRELLAEMKMLMPQLPLASLRSAIQELEQHLGASAGRYMDRAAVSSPVAQPAFGQIEEEEEPPPADADAERGDAASVGSLDGDARESGEGEEEEEQDGAAGAPSAGREEQGGEDAFGGIDNRLWPGSGPVTGLVDEHLNNDYGDPRYAGERGEGAEAAALPRDPRLGAGPFVRRDSIGLAAHGRHLYCDYCDLHGPCANACTAVDMLQQRTINKLVNQHQRRRARRPSVDPAGSEARHACYKAVVAWQWASPLGAEQRVQLPRCVMCGVRKLFPNPRCGEGCDYGAKCERLGHYVGFRTAAESKRVREGRDL